MSAHPPTSTPSRVTRARSKTPLPAIGAKQTNAYGAKGKTELRSQVRAGGDDFAAAFAGQRSMATGGASTTPSASERSGSEEPGRAPPVPLQPTAMESVAAYSGGATANRQPEIEQNRSVPMPNLSRLSLWLLVLFGLFSGFLLSAVPMPSYRLEAARHNILSGLRQAFHARPYDVPPAELADRWFRFQHNEIFLQLLPDANVPELQWSVNIHLLSRLVALEGRVASLESDIHLTNDTLSEIEQLLPAIVMLRKVDGHYDIPDDFWSALQQRMVENTDQAPLWRAFVLRNEDQLKQLEQEHLDGVFDRALANGHIVTREVFMQAIKENNDWLANEYSQELKKMWSQNMDNLKALTENAATEIIDRSQISYYAKQQVDFLKKANTLHNTYEALRSVNYFSAVGGARVDPRITSPTVRKNYRSRILNALTKYTSSSMRSLPPIEALFEWKEAKECWCGTPTDKANGGVNIGVLTSHGVYPERLVIEHIPAAATFDIAAAPRTFEVWADAGSKAAAKKFDNVMRETIHQSVVPNCKSKPMERFVCIGVGEYNIHEPNHIQTFRLWDDMKEYGFATDRIIVRATTNWGANHTCFYRLRLTGTKA